MFQVVRMRAPRVAWRRNLAGQGPWTSPWVIVLVGCGVVGRAFVLTLTALGRFEFVLVDPKGYGAPHAAMGQCSPAEIGCQKVEAVADLVRQRGSRVTPLPHDISTLGDGVFGRRVLLVTALDSLPAQLAANQIARRTRAPTLRLNTAPSLGVASARLYATHRADGACVECGVTPRQILGSLAAPPASTNRCGPETSVLLARMAAYMGRFVVEGLSLPDVEPALMWNREWQVSLDSTGELLTSMPRKRSCTTCRLPAWGQLTYDFAHAPHSTLGHVVNSVSRAKRGVRVTFCHRFVSRVACPVCGTAHDFRGWHAAYQRYVATCATCGHGLEPVKSADRFTLRQLKVMGLWYRPLANLRLPRGAIINVSTRTARKSFVIEPLCRSVSRPAAIS